MSLARREFTWVVACSDSTTRSGLAAMRSLRVSITAWFALVFRVIGAELRGQVALLGFGKNQVGLEVRDQRVLEDFRSRIVTAADIVLPRLAVLQLCWDRRELR